MLYFLKGFLVCDDYSGLSALLYLTLIKAQMSGHISEKFFFIIRSFEVGRHTYYLNI